MTYAYNTHGAPAVGGGLPGLPQRQSSGGITSGAIPVNAQFGYADEQPANAVEVGAIVEREDYPALSAQIPHTFEQTVQLPLANPIPSTSATLVSAWSKSTRWMLLGRADASQGINLIERTGDALTNAISLVGGGAPTMTNITSMAFGADDQYAFVGCATNSSPLVIFKKSTPYYSYITNVGGSSWPVKLLAVSPDGTLLAAASSTTSSGVDRVKLWRRSGDTFTAVTLPNVLTNEVVTSLFFTNDGQKLIYLTLSGTNAYLRGWNVSSTTPAALSYGYPSSTAVTAYATPIGNSEIVVWSIPASGESRASVYYSESNFQQKYTISTQIPRHTLPSILGSPILVADNGSTIVFGIYTARKGSNGVYVADFLRVFPELSAARARSLSGDSKFLALGLSDSPWLRVYGSESKMVARLNERSQTGQKLYMKAG